jgi:diadenosine tetraphosphate (Ap4A) HIT family hydrolase
MRDIYKKQSVQKKYKKYLKEDKPNEDCVFCRKNYLKGRAVEGSNSLFTVVEALAPYDYWDMKEVQEHLMIVPNRHISSLHDMNEAESKKYVAMVKEYAKNNYDIYVRNHRSKVKTVTHLHIHCFRTDEVKHRVLLKYWI